MSWARLLTLLRQTSRRLWVRVAAFAVLAVLAVALSGSLGWVVPDKLTKTIGPDALMPVLTILASSMLAVSTFSLNVMVSAHRAAAAQATPRVHHLLLEDTTTQNVMGVFIGAFVYALTAIILFGSHLTGAGAAVLMMGVTVAVVVLVILSMLRWIDHLSRLGSLEDTLHMTEQRAASALHLLARAPTLGATPLTDDTVLPDTVTPVPAPRSGYLQMIDMAALAECSGEGLNIYLLRTPGHVVLEGRAMAQIGGTPSDEVLARISRCFVIGDMRNFDQDPEFALTVLSEVSSRALSPGVNDPGTAMDVISRIERLLWSWDRKRDADPQVHYPHVFMRAPSAADLLNAGFAATARDGAGSIEVARHLMDALDALQRSPARDMIRAAQEMQDKLLAHAETTLTLPADLAALKSVASK